MSTPSRYRGRFAPSPTGPLHLGSLVAALGSWLIARRNGGDWLLRIEDIDPPREIPGAAIQQIEALKAFGLYSDEPVLWQSARGDAYADALDRLRGSGDAFECRCSRSDLAADAGVHRGCVRTDTARQPAIRLRVADERVGFDDAIQGRSEQSAREQIGDFVLRRADSLWAYQLAVVVDDAAQGITQVVRGADLLDSTPRQILLQQMLGLPTPAYAHLPVVVDASGRKLGKSSATPAVDPADPFRALRTALHALGQDPRCVAAVGNAEAALSRALEHFDTDAIPRTATIATSSA